MHQIGLGIVWRKVACSVVIGVAGLTPLSSGSHAGGRYPGYGRATRRLHPRCFPAVQYRNSQCRPHHDLHDGQEGQPGSRLPGRIHPRQSHEGTALVSVAADSQQLCGSQAVMRAELRITY
jgi:hypothetical protein